MSLDQVQAEALKAEQVVTWRAVKFTVAPVNDWLVLFMHYYERDQLTRAIEAALGSAQYARFIEAGPTLGDLEVLMQSIASAFGIDLGEA